MQLGGAIFDMDGTLLDSMPVWDNISGRIFAEYGVTLSEQDYVAMEAKTQEQVAELLLHTYSDVPLTLDELLQKTDALIESRYRLLAKNRPYIAEFLQTLRQAGVKTAVATLTARRHALRVLDEQGLLPYFDTVMAVEQVGTSKREPALFLSVAEALSVPHTACMVFEDAPYACTTAKKADFMVCGVIEPHYAAGEAELRAASDFVVEQSFTEILAYLRQNRLI